ncbi:hypothetical protein [Streptomyces sp. NBC_00076]|uniref:hypothetical protein n=1 Tax=Streptomyces sp. NBC_00076 TaxID=2975642 RepID=UPI003246E99F
MAGNTGKVERSGRVRNARPHVAASGVEAVLRLAEGLPALADVREVGEHERSDLTQTEQLQLQQTEEVIGAALAAGDAALWVIAQGLERAARGRWWRATHASLAAYVEERIGRSAGYVRQLRLHAPLALETVRRTGTVPKPSQMVVTRRTEQRHGLDVAVTLFEVVRDVAAELGGQTTAEVLKVVQNNLPKHLPEQNDAQRTAIEQIARRTLAQQPSAPGPDREPPRPAPRMAGHRQIRPLQLTDVEQKSNVSARIRALTFESNSNSGASRAAPTADATPVAHLRTLEEALAALAAIDQSLTGDVYAQAAADPEQTSEYERIRQHIIIRAAAIRANALRAPTA